MLFLKQNNETTFIPPSPLPQHALLFVAKGSSRYSFGERAISVHKGELLFMPSQTVRAAERSPYLEIYSAHFHGELPEELVHLRGEPYTWIRPLGVDYLKQRFSLLHECWIGKMSCYKLISQGMLLEILGVVQRELCGTEHSIAQRNIALQVQQYIVKRYREPLKLKELAREVDRTPTYVATVFKEVTGRSPIQYLHEVRIAAARELLLTSQLSIRQIADSLGYCDQAYFNLMYKKLVGYPPSHTIKEHRP